MEFVLAFEMEIILLKVHGKDIGYSIMYCSRL